MGLKNETQFYVFELKLSLTGRFVQNNSKLTDEEKARSKRSFFDNLLKNYKNFKEEYNIKNLLSFLNSADLKYSLANSLIKLEHFQFIDESNTIAACLFFFANRNIQANDLYDFQTDSERKIEQQDYEGVRLVSHLIFRVTQNPITKENHLFAALEARSHIYPSQIQKTLNSILREWVTQYEDDERKISVHPQLEVLAIKSETLEDILRSGKIKGIKLIKNIPVNQAQDESPFICTGRSELYLTPPRNVKLSIDEQLSGISSVVKSRKSEYETLKVTMDINGISKTNEYDLPNDITPEALLQEYFFHKEILHFDENIVDANYENLAPKIVEKVRNEVLTNEKLKISN